MPDGMTPLAVDYDGLIPNNVQLNQDMRVRKALESWHPGYIDWWKDAGPDGFQESLVYLRTAIGVDPKGWAKFDYVKMPDYKWGVLLAPAVEGRVVPFGKHKGEPAWQEVPGEYRAMLRRLITIQGDTEPASVEQQRHLGKTAPSLYDLRNLFQVNVEEGRHLWAMVYLLQKYFGKEGREEADDLLRRRSGHVDAPRMLGAFNEATPDWLSFFMFTFFTDRDGKMQLEALAQSAFDPLSRTCRFMLTEEAHHMFVGDSGVQRVIERTCQAMAAAGITDPNDVAAVRALGVIDLPTIQKKMNLHFSLTLDLFGNEISTNAANAFVSGIKGRYREDKLTDDHMLADDTYPVLRCRDGVLVEEAVPALSALNMRLRDDYVKDCASGVTRWNRVIEKAGFSFQLALPHVAFNRAIGEFSAIHADVAGRVLDDAAWAALVPSVLPDDADAAFITSLMVAVAEPGAFAGWIAAPKVGIDNKGGDFEYVQIHGETLAPPDAVKQHLIDPEVCIRCNTCEATCPIGAITHDDNNYVVDAAICNFCMDCVSPCPTGSIDHWFVVNQPFSLEDQYSWLELPPQPVVAAPAVDALEDEAAALLADAHRGAGGRARAPASASKPRINLFNRASPALATVTGNFRITAPGASADVRHIILDFGTVPFPVLEGQSIGLVPPGMDAAGKPHAMRLYSVASARDGERPNTNNLALTVKRVVEARPEGEFRGLASNWLCDLPRGASVPVIGPFGSTFLMPDEPDADILMVCTGTGAAPFRGFTERRRRTSPNGRGRLHLFFGARSADELPYFGPLQKVPAAMLRQELVYSRAPGRPREYVQDRMRAQADEIAALLKRPELHIYICGLRGLEEGVEVALTEIARAHGQDWIGLRDRMRDEGRFHSETY